MIIFLNSDVQPLSGFSTSIKSINQPTLPDEIYFRPSSIRKWIQIKIWAYEPISIFHFKSLASSICCRPRKWRFPWHRITLRVGMRPSCSTSHFKCLVDPKIIEKVKMKPSDLKKSIFQKKFKMIIFFSSEVQPSSGFSTSIKSIGSLILPDVIYFSSRPIRKWIQIQIWTDEPIFIFDFKSLTLPKCRRPQKWRFSWHRITLRVGMRPSCSTSHFKCLVDPKIIEKVKMKPSDLKKSIFQKKFKMIIFFSSEVQPSSGFSTSIKSIGSLILPDVIYFSSRPIRKWIQIQIWTYEPRFIFDFKSLRVSKCGRPQKWRFSWHRITLRVGRRPSCSTSHFKCLVASPPAVGLCPVPL